MKLSTKLAYPKNWKEISKKIRLDRKNRCELCGTRSIKNNCLTVHHINFNPRNNSYTNLTLLCQKCHLKVQAMEAIFTLKDIYEIKVSRQRQLKLNLQPTHHPLSPSHENSRGKNS